MHNGSVQGTLRKASQVEAPQDLRIVIPTHNNTQTHFVDDSKE